MKKEQMQVNSSKTDFTIVLPIRGTERELKFMDKSIPSAIAFNPGELIFACDEGMDHRVHAKIIELVKKYGFTNYKVKFFPRDSDWGFQLANVIWNCYKMAKYDKILSFDVDSSLRKEAMIGYDIIGQDRVAVCSFTKKLLIKNILDLHRFIFYRFRVWQSNYVFSGIYWVYRPYYFENVNKDDFMKIRNGVDTFLTNSIMEKGIHKIVTRKEMGCDCHDYQNEDYPWRQFQTGVWMHANQEIAMASKILKLNRKYQLSKLRNVTKTGLACLLDVPIGIISKLFKLRTSQYAPLLFTVVKSFMYAHPYLLSGYRWAGKHPDHEAVKLAKTLTYDEWGYRGGEVMKLIGKKWKRSDGTGF